MGANPRHAAECAHPFYLRLNQILDTHHFDGYVEELCRRFYADDGRPGRPPGRYFRLLLIGYFEGLDAEHAIAWLAADSFALRGFLGLLPEAAPDQRLADAGLVKGIAMDILLSRGHIIQVAKWGNSLAVRLPAAVLLSADGVISAQVVVWTRFPSLKRRRRGKVAAMAHSQ